MRSPFLFDLDMTLVDSSKVAHLRAMRRWNDALQNLHKVRAFPFDPAPHTIPAKLMRMGHPVAIVTSSPETYAEAIIERFGIKCDVLVAYHDTEEHKPQPEPLTLALKRLKTGAELVYHVGDHVDDIEASYHAGVTSVLAAWGAEDLAELSSSAPDIVLHDPGPLIVPMQLRRYGYVAERIVAGKKVCWHTGSSLLCEGDGEVIAAGRYFASADKRHGASELTDALLKFKHDDTPTRELARILSLVLESWYEDRPLVIASVPPKPKQSRDRFAALFNELEPLLPKGVRIVRDALTCVHEISNYKSLGRAARKEAVRGAYESAYTWRGQRILLVDDIHTTGSTVEACRAALLEDGAAEVRVFCFAKDQHAFEAPEACPECGMVLKVQTNRTDGSKFWGCSGYWTTQCPYKRPYP